MKDSVLILLKLKLESLLPFDFYWLEIISEEVEELRRNFSWQKCGKKIFNLAGSLLVLYLLWDFIAPIRELMHAIAIMIAVFHVQIFLFFLPFILFFSTIELISVFGVFVAKPSKIKMKIFLHSMWSCLLFWGIYFADKYYGHYVQTLIENT